MTDALLQLLDLIDGKRMARTKKGRSEFPFQWDIYFGPVITVLRVDAVGPARHEPVTM